MFKCFLWIGLFLLSVMILLAFDFKLECKSVVIRCRTFSICAYCLREPWIIIEVSYYSAIRIFQDLL